MLELHDLHNSLPLAVKRLEITKEMLSPYALFFDRNFKPTEKLVPNLQDKLNYTTHYRNLKLYLEQVCLHETIHRQKH